MAATNNYTQKSLAAIQRAQQIAVEYQHMQVDEEHLAAALTEDAAGLIPQLLNACGAPVGEWLYLWYRNAKLFGRAARKAIDAL